MPSVSERPTPEPSRLVLGQTVHYRAAGRCWAAAIVEAGPEDRAQVYLFPLPPTYRMPAAPGTFVPRDGATTEETWHRLEDCADAANARREDPPARRRGRSRTRRSQAPDRPAG